MSLVEEVDQIYNERRERLNTLAEDRHFLDQVNAHNARCIESNAFNHIYYINRLVIDAAEVVVHNTRVKKWIPNLNFVHSANEYYHDYKNHNMNMELERENARLANDYLDMIILVLPKPKNLAEALAQKKLLANVPTDTLDGKYLTRFNQIRDKSQTSIEIYKHQADLDSFQRVNEKIVTLEQKQNEAINRITRQHEILNEVKHLVATLDERQISIDEKLVLLQQQLAEYGLHVDESFLMVIQRHELLATGLSQVLGYLDKERQIKHDQAEQQALIAQYQGLSDTSQLLIAVGQISGNKTISLIGRIAFNTVTIAQTAHMLITQKIAGLALLTPYSAMAMAALQLFSLFRSNNNDDTNQFILKQLALLSRQIQSLHHELKTEFADLNRKIDHYFYSLMRQIQWLEKTLLLSMQHQLSIISQDMQLLRMITITGFRHVLLKELWELVSHHNDLTREISSRNIINKTDAENMLRKLRDYACFTSRTELFTGTIYKGLLGPETLITLSRLNETLAEHRESPHDIIGLIFLYAKHGLQLPQLKSISDNAIFNITIFLTAINTYGSLKTILKDVVLYDPDKMNDLAFVTVAENVINFLLCLQQEKLIYQQFFSKISDCIERINAVVTHFVSTHSNAHAFSMLLSFNDLLNTHKGKRPQSYGFQPFEVEPDLSGRQENQDFFKQENITNIIENNGFIIPDIFILAEALKLGQFECRFVAPTNIDKKRHTSETDPHKYTLKPCRGGMDIRFVFRSGISFSLYIASELSGEHKFGPLRKLYAHSIKEGTKPNFNETMLKHVFSLVSQEWLSLRKELTLLISNQISIAYTRLINQSYWLQLFGALAHFPQDFITSIGALHEQIMSIMEYQIYTKSATIESDFPSIPALSITQLSVDVTTWIEAQGNNKLHNPLVCQLETELRPVRENCLLQTAIEIDANKTEVQLEVADTFFAGSPKSTTSTSTLAPHFMAKL